MTINDWLKNTVEKLKLADIPTARLDAEILLADELIKDRSWILAHDDFSLQGQTLQKLDEQVERRQKHEPIAYIRGRQEFYGREFMVSPDTLTPRPETETMVELLLKQTGNWGLETGENRIQIVDVGTGSGCIVITTALELSSISSPQSQISYLGLDISEPALEIASKNAENLGAEVDFRKFDLTKDRFTLHPSPFTLITANLPYVPNDFHINLAATHEPSFAIFGGTDGLDYYRLLFEQLSRQYTTDSNQIATKKGSLPLHSSLFTLVFTEALPPQHGKLASIAKKAGFNLQKSQDFIQIFSKV